MANIREMFHKVGNWHNKISVSAGVTKIELKERFKEKAMPAEIKKLIEVLTDLEKNAVGASRSLNELKALVYDIIEPDSGKPKR
ncbi:MAG: hypothetical protein AB1481_02940 [Candidatus Omnitrophota bacterium]